MKIKSVEVYPGIVIYEDIISNSKELIDLALSDKDKWRDSTLGENSDVDKSIRNTRILDVPYNLSNDLRWFEVAQKVWECADEYAKHFQISFSNMESPQILHYSTNDGFYLPHADSGPGLPRIFSAVLYLNDVQDGGETYFDKIGVSIPAIKNNLAIFPADYVYTHEAKTPKSNDKFALVTWFTPVF